jgi:hypothetical protein
MPLTNFCNRTVVTSTLGNPRSRAQGSHPADFRFWGRPFSPAALPARERSFPYTEAPNDHGGRPTSNGAALGTARASWSPSSTCRRPDRGPDCFFLRGAPHTRLCRPCTRWLTRLLTLPVAPPSLPDLRWPSGLLTEPRAPSTDGTPMPPLSEPEASSTDESRIRAPLLALGDTVRAATSAPGFATRAPLPTRVHPLAAS